MKSLRMLACWLALFAIASPAPAQDKKPSIDPRILYLNTDEAGKIPEKGYAGIDKATVAAYRKIGAAWVLKPSDRGVPLFCFSGLLGERKLDLTQKFPDAPVDFGLHFTEGAPMTDAGMKQLAALKHLTVLHLTHTKVTPAGLKELAGLKKLKRLELENEKINDAALRTLRKIGLLHALRGANVSWPQWIDYESDDGVKEFSLFQTKVTDAGMKELAVFKNLETLNLPLTRVTGTGLKALAGLKKLHDIELSTATDDGLKGIAMLKNLTSLKIATTPMYRAKVTYAGIAALQKALPKCKIQR